MRFTSTGVRAGLRVLGMAIPMSWLAPNAMIHTAWGKTIVDEWSNAKAL